MKTSMRMSTEIELYGDHLVKSESQSRYTLLHCHVVMASRYDFLPSNNSFLLDPAFLVRTEAQDR